MLLRIKFFNILRNFVEAKELNMNRFPATEKELEISAESFDVVLDQLVALDSEVNTPAFRALIMAPVIEALNNNLAELYYDLGMLNVDFTEREENRFKAFQADIDICTITADELLDEKEPSRA